MGIQLKLSKNEQELIMSFKYDLSKYEYEVQIKEGGSTFIPTTELVGIVLFPNRKPDIRNKLAKKILKKMHNSIDKLFANSSVDFFRETGLGNKEYIKFRAMRELLERAIMSDLDNGESLNSSEKTKKLLISKLRFQAVELFVCLYLNSQYQLISFEQHTIGTVNGTFVHTREIVKRSVELNASALIIAHNHPSGSSIPSESDSIITNQISDALKLIEVVLLDHFIVSGNKVSSLAEKGMI